MKVKCLVAPMKPKTTWEDELEEIVNDFIKDKKVMSVQFMSVSSCWVVYEDV